MVFAGYKDSPEVADDQPGTWFRIDLTVAGSPEFWASSIDGFESVDEAVAHFATSVTWDT